MIRGLHHIGIAVPDMSVAEQFIPAFGLNTTRVGDSLHASSDGRDQNEIVFMEGPTKKLAHVAFAVGAGALDGTRAALRDAGIDIIDDIANGLSISDPDGNAVHLLGVDPARTREVSAAGINSVGIVTRLNEHYWQQAKADSRPFRLGHSLIFSPQPEEMEQFYVDVLGLGLSDRITGKVTFLNTGSGDHHVFGFIRSSHPGLHHVSFEVTGIDAIATTAERLVANGHTTGWGIGRHSIGSNLFYYAADPWGSWFEVFTDLDSIDETWEPADWDLPPAIWGGPPPADFIVNKEAR